MTSHGSPTRRRLAVIVEGYGEADALPVLINRWIKHARAYNWTTRQQAIRASGVGALKCQFSAANARGIEYYVRMALRDRPDAILVVLDADKECEQRSQRRAPGLGPELLARAKNVAPHVPTTVVVADREYEAWFLSNFVMINEHVGFNVSQMPKAPIEAIHNCKKVLGQLLGRRYEPSTDQPNLTQYLPLLSPNQAPSRSYRKLLTALTAVIPPIGGETD